MLCMDAGVFIDADADADSVDIYETPCCAWGQDPGRGLRLIEVHASAGQVTGQATGQVMERTMQETSLAQFSAAWRSKVS